MSRVGGLGKSDLCLFFLKASHVLSPLYLPYTCMQVHTQRGSQYATKHKKYIFRILNSTTKFDSCLIHIWPKQYNRLIRDILMMTIFTLSERERKKEGRERGMKEGREGGMKEGREQRWGREE